jgi:glycosyltransferase involved in cell wall biosynthesis
LKPSSAPPRVGFITYDLQEFTADCLARIAERMPGRLKAYPLFDRVDAATLPFQFEPSTKKGRFFAVRRKGSTPEGFTSSINLRAAIRSVLENDVVVLFGLQGATVIVAATLARLLRRKVVSVNQTLPLEYEARRRWWVRGLKQYVLGLCQWHVVQSPASTEVLTRIYGASSNRLVMAPFEGGATLMKERMQTLRPRRDALRQEHGWSENMCVFIFVGTLLQFKGTRTMIEAFARARHGGVDARLLLVGPAAAQPREPSLDDYRRMATELRVAQDVSVLGRKNLDELAALYVASDVLVLPTNKDTWGKVIAEAAMAGLPHITTSACGAIGAIVEDKRTGRVVEPGNVDDLARAMIEMSDKEIRTRCGREAERLCLDWCDPVSEALGYTRAITQAWAGAGAT